MPPPPTIPQIIPLPQNIPFTISPPPLTPLPSLCTPPPNCSPPGERPMNRSHSTGEKADCHERKWFEYHCDVKQEINGPHPLHQQLLRTTIYSKHTHGCEEGKTFTHQDDFLLLFPPNHFWWMTLYTSQQLVKHVEKGTTKGEMIKWFGIIILSKNFEFGGRAILWYTISQ